MRFNKFLNYKNFDSYKIIEVINNCAYKLKLFESMQSIFFVFHSWLLHLNESNSLFEQRQTKSFSIIIEKESKWKLNKIVNLKIDKRINDFITKTREMLQYRVKYKNWDTWNQTFKWQSFIDFNNAQNAVVDYHYEYLERFDSHATFKQSKNWKFSNSI